MRFAIIASIIIGCAVAPSGTVRAQCTNYTITVGGGLYDFEVSWNMVNELGAVVASGFAPTTVTACLPDGCYQLNLYDSFGDGWNGATYSVAVTATGVLVGSGTLANGSSGTMQVSLGGGCSSGDCDMYTMVVTAGLYPTEVNWNLVTGPGIVATGFAPTTLMMCLDTGCYTMQLFDAFGDGWNGATWTLNNAGGASVGSGTLGTGSIGQATFPIGVPAANCASAGPITASDCPEAVNICTNINFSIDPNGIGSMNEIPSVGSYGNPLFYYGDGSPSPWGSDNEGCLLNNELNSTWMVVNISQGGMLEFTFGGLSTQVGFYDWIMYPYSSSTCSAIPANTQAPVSCNWNWVSYGGTGLASTVPSGGDAGNFEPPLAVQTGDQYIICFSNWSSVSTVVPLQFGGTAVVSCEPLPIELLAFHAKRTEGGILMDWSTASEKNTSHFVVQRSADLMEWEGISELRAAGSSYTTLAYRYLDAEPIDGVNYYRLQMVDMDGTMEFSPIEQATWSLSGMFAYPNPNRGAFQVHAPSGEVEIMDAMGRTVYRSSASTVGNADPSVQLTTPGIYTLASSDGADRATTRIVVFE
ncbi:MAG: T9SS type A sorting domain-containing protein [Flavobacteriales bacterium]|nr:T9SS type A sorting domain-containing protein [Flavobacteriales bacterium]